VSDDHAPAPCDQCDANARAGNNYCGHCGRYVADPSYSLSPGDRYLLSQSVLRFSPSVRYALGRVPGSSGDAVNNQVLENSGMHTRPGYDVAGADSTVCPRCQGTNLVSDHFCVACGSELGDEVREPAPPTLPW